MAIIKKFSPFQNLSNFSTFVNDDNPNSEYFKITELRETLTGGKNGFLIEGCPELKESSDVKIELLDVEGNPIYFEPGNGVPEYYEGTSKLISVHIYDDTPIGAGKITILGELKKYRDSFGALVDVPNEWKGVYNVKWEKTFQVNKNLSNESIVRFYKRPTVEITELIKPIFSKSIPTVTETGHVHGFALVPDVGSDLSTWRAGVSYGLERTSGSWDVDVDENVINLAGLNYSPRIIEVLNSKQVLVDVPYTVNNIVEEFESGSYSVSYTDFQNQVIGETSLTGSFAKIDFSKLKTFVGDVARVKVFRKSRNAVGDFQFVQESKLESSELLRDITTNSDTELSYGRFDESNLSNYWITSSNDHVVSVDSDTLSQALKFDYDTTAGGVQKLITSQSLSVSKDVEYTLNFKTILSGALDDTDKSITAYFSSSNFTQNFLTIDGSAIYRARQSVSQNIISENTGDAKLVFEVQGDDWYISNASLRNAQDTSFSPDEFTLIQDIPRKTISETFDFKFEFYDINNNYIPVDVLAVGVFDGGNDFPTSAKLLTFESDRNAFRFSSGSVQNPKGQQIQFKLTQNNLTGSTLFESSAFDTDGNYLNPSDYTQYPGLLTSVNPAGGIITINNFTGSRTDGLYEPFVGSVVYTASLESEQEFETVYRLEDGDNAPQLIVTSNANQFTYEPTTLSSKPSGQSITVRAQRKNLASLITPIEVNSGSNRPPLNFVETVNGIDSYSITSNQFSASFASNNFDEVTYSFTGSDVFGNKQSDEITLSKVINFDAVSLVLSNESTTFPAKSTGVVIGGLASSVGTVQMNIGSSQITHDDVGDGRAKNTFDITSVSGTNVTPISTSPTSNSYGISAFSNTKDSGSLTLNIEYLAGDNATSQSFQKIVSYTKAKNSVPNIELAVSPIAQTIAGNSRGSGSATPNNLTLSATEGGTSRFGSIGNPTYSGGLTGSISTNTIVITDSASDMTSDTETITIPVTFTDSEGTQGTKTIVSTISRTRVGQPNVEVSGRPLAQTIEANSLGSGSATPQNILVKATEGGTDRFTSIHTPTFSNGLTGSISSNTLSITSTASDMTDDTGTILIPVKFTDGEGTLGQKDVQVVVTRVRKAQPSSNFKADPQAQTIDADSLGSLNSNITDITIKGADGNTELTYNQGTLDAGEFKITDVTGVTVDDTTPSTSTIDVTSFSGNSAIGIASISFKDFEGTLGTQEVKFSFSKATAAVPNVEVFVTPQAQTINANSVGSGSDVPSSLRIDAREGGTNRFTSFGTISFTGGLAGSGDNSTELFTFTSDASDMTSDTGTVSIPVNFTDGEGTSGTKTIEATVSRVRVAQPNTNFSVTPAAQTIDADSVGSLNSSITDVRIDGFDGNTALTYNPATLAAGQYKITNVTGVTVDDTTPASSIIDVTGFTGDSATGTASIAFKDNEGTEGTTTIKFTLSKSLSATPTTIISANPQAQTVDSNANFSTVGNPSAVSIIVNQGGDDYGYDTSGAIAKNKFRITGVTSGSNNNNGTITPTTPSDGDGTTSVVTLSYTNSEGTTLTGKTITVNVGVAVQGESITGADGKRTATGMIHYQETGSTQPATPSATSYTFSNGTFTSLTADWGLGAPTYSGGNENKYWYSTYSVVETTAGGGTGTPTFGDANQAIGFTGLVTFTADDSVSNGSGNALSFGTSGTTAIHGDNISTGRIISTNWNDSASGTTNGILTSTGYAAAGMAINLDSGSIHAEQFKIESDGTATFSGNLSAAGGSFDGDISAATGTFGASIAIGTGDDIFKAGASGIQLGDATFADAPFRVNMSGDAVMNSATIGPVSVTSTAFKVVTGTGAGAGDFGNANTQLYIDSNGQFSLGDKLSFDSNGDLSMTGAITIAAGSTSEVDFGAGAAASASAAQSNAESFATTASGNAALSASAAQSDADAANTAISTNSAAWSAGDPNPSSYSFGGNGFTLATNTASAGLNLTSQYLGYHDGSEFKSYMASNGDFYLGGTSGALTWDHSSSTLNVNRVTATTGTIGGWNIDSNSLYSGTKGSSGNFTSAGGITIGSSGFISANGFYIDTSGNFVQNKTKSKLSDGSNIRPFGDIFDVDSDELVIKSSTRIGSGTNRSRFSSAFSFSGNTLRINDSIGIGSSSTSIGTRFTNIATNFSTIDDYDSTVFGSCVLPGTKIISKRGEINVEDTKEDDIIKIFNFETNEWGWSSIDEIITNKVQGWSKIETELGKKLKCSNSHLLYHPDYPNCEISVDKLGVGGELYVYDGERLVIDKIKSIESFDDEVEVWNYELDVVHNYISDGILSHNMAAKLQQAATLGHPYKKRISENISRGDLVKLDSNNELIKVSSAKDTSVVGILWEKYELKITNLITGSVEDGYTPYTASEEMVSASYLDSFGNYLTNNETGSKEMWRVASLGDSIEWNLSGSYFSLTGFKMCNQGGDVVPGDLLCSSDTPGYLMKQPSEWVVTGFNGDSTPIYEERQSQCSYTVAKSMESSSWDSNGKMEGVYGYLYCG